MGECGEGAGWAGQEVRSRAGSRAGSGAAVFERVATAAATAATAATAGVAGATACATAAIGFPDFIARGSRMPQWQLSQKGDRGILSTKIEGRAWTQMDTVAY